MSGILPVDVYSPDQIGIALWELEGLAGNLQNIATRAAVAPGGIPQQEVQISSFLINILRANSVRVSDRPALEQLQVDLKALRDSAPVAHIILGGSPSRTLKHELVEWFRRELHPEHLATFATRSDIGGGFMLRVGSKQYDFTYRKRLLEDSHRLTEIFDSVR